MRNSEEKGYVSQIQGFSVNDGEGIRTTIFLSGCPLRCKWCCNPETWTIDPQLALFKEKCIGCGRCVEICPTAQKKCSACGRCTEVCPVGARKIMGTKMSVKEVVDVVKKDMIFFRESNGGVTFSGGEATFQQDFLRALTSEFKKYGIDMAIETSGYFTWDELKHIFEELDFIFVDIKHMDGKRHRELTGVDNSIILENIKKIGELNKPVVVRIPLVKGINDTEENIVSAAKYVKKHVPCGKMEILPYHNLGESKYETIGWDRFKHTFDTPSQEEIKKVKKWIYDVGVEIVDYK
ncbi:glycyl-radical enzyme activating protein [Clostridium sp. Mt-5]|uniref:Glycyl-radical enzyme activating protein n=1 Tax=Clostridium moutaii TaxID=3240932 RepID=A0ABV4BKK9_9CLOT